MQYLVVNILAIKYLDVNTYSCYNLNLQNLCKQFWINRNANILSEQVYFRSVAYILGQNK